MTSPPNTGPMAGAATGASRVYLDADIACDPGVEVAVFDHDAFASDPEATAGVPSSFKGLAEVLGVPVEAHHE